MLEAAIVMPVAISLMVGCIEFGNLFLGYGTAAKSVRDAARYLARAPQANLCTGGLTIATNLAIYGNTSGTGDALIPPTSTITMPGTDCANPIGNYVTVQAVVPYTPLMFSGIPFTSIQFFGNATVTHKELYIGSLL
jgi:Flp pilus assembly protein TadG